VTTLEPFRSRFQTETETGFCTSYTQCVTCVMVTKCHNLRFVTSVICSGFVLVFLAKEIWSHFVHKCHKWSQIHMRLVQPCFCFCFDWNVSDWTKYGKTYQKVSSVSVFCLESGSERLLVSGLRLLWGVWSATNKIVNKNTTSISRPSQKSLIQASEHSYFYLHPEKICTAQTLQQLHPKVLCSNIETIAVTPDLFWC